jgi:hypothetical protein
MSPWLAQFIFRSIRRLKFNNDAFKRSGIQRGEKTLCSGQLLLAVGTGTWALTPAS